MLKIFNQFLVSALIIANIPTVAMQKSATDQQQEVFTLKELADKTQKKWMIKTHNVEFYDISSKNPTKPIRISLSQEFANKACKEFDANGLNVLGKTLTQKVAEGKTAEQKIEVIYAHYNTVNLPKFLRALDNYIDNGDPVFVSGIIRKLYALNNKFDAKEMNHFMKYVIDSAPLASPVIYGLATILGVGILALFGYLAFKALKKK